MDELECEQPMHVNSSVDGIKCISQPTLTALHVTPEPKNKVLKLMTHRDRDSA